MRARLLLVPIMLCAAAACGTTPHTAIQRIQIIADPGVNRGSAAALDIVFVYDAAAVAMLPRNGPEWFDKKKALLAGLATGIDVVTLEVPQVTTVEVQLPARTGKAIAVYSYANYIAADGQPVGNLTPYKTMTIRLTPDNVLYSGS